METASIITKEIYPSRYHPVLECPILGFPKKSKWIEIFPTAFFLQKTKTKRWESFKNAQNVHPNPA